MFELIVVGGFLFFALVAKDQKSVIDELRKENEDLKKKKQG